jgi:hypothetical protein
MAYLGEFMEIMFEQTGIYACLFPTKKFES